MSTHRLCRYALFEHEKVELLLHLLNAAESHEGVIVFVKTRDSVHAVTARLQQEGFKAGSIHANKKKEFRAQILADLESGKLEVLVTTTALAGDLTIESKTGVINYDLPERGEGFVPLMSDATAPREVAFFTTPENTNLLRKWEELMANPLPLVEAEGFAYATKAPLVRPAKPTKQKGYRSKPLQNKKPKLKFKYSGKQMPKAKKPRGSK